MGEQAKQDVKGSEATTEDHAAIVEEGYDAATPPESQGDGDPTPRTATPDAPGKQDKQEKPVKPADG